MSMRNVMMLALTVIVPIVTYAQVPIQPVKDQLTLLQSPDPQLASNKRLIYDYFREVLEAGHTELVTKYIAADFIQHDPNLAGGRDEFATFVKARRPHPQPFAPTLKVPLLSIVAERDLVVMIYLRSLPLPTSPGVEYITTNAEIYRLSNGQIAEHWTTSLRN